MGVHPPGHFQSHYDRILSSTLNDLYNSLRKHYEQEQDLQEDKVYHLTATLQLIATKNHLQQHKKLTLTGNTATTSRNEPTEQNIYEPHNSTMRHQQHTEQTRTQTQLPTQHPTNSKRKTTTEADYPETRYTPR